MDPVCVSVVAAVNARACLRLFLLLWRKQTDHQKHMQQMKDNEPYDGSPVPGVVYVLSRYYPLLSKTEWRVVCVTETIEEALWNAWATHRANDRHRPTRADFDEHKIEKFVVSSKQPPMVYTQVWKRPNTYSSGDYWNTFSPSKPMTRPWDAAYGKEDTEDGQFEWP